MTILLGAQRETANEKKIKLIFANLTSLMKGEYAKEEIELIRDCLNAALEKVEETLEAEYVCRDASED